MRKVYHLYKQNQEKVLTFADQAVQSGGNFLTGILYSKELGLHAYGEFVLVWMLVLFASSLQQAFIFNPTYNIYASKNDEDKSFYMSKLWVLNAGFAFLSAAVIGIGIFIAKHWISSFANLYLIIPLISFVYLMYDFLRKKLILENKIMTTLVLDIISNALLILPLIAFSSLENISINLILSLTFGSYLACLILGYIFKPWKVRFHGINELFQEHWEQGKWLCATSLLQWFAGNYFIVAAGSILGAKEIGVIRIAQNIVGVINVLFIAMENYIPRYASAILFSSGKQALFRYLKSITWKGLLITSFICLGLAMSSGKIVSLMFGDMYVKYNYVVQIFCYFNILIFIGIPLKHAIRTLEYQHNIFIAYLLSALFSLASANFLIKNFGLYGTLAGIIMAQIVIQSWYLYILKNHIYEYCTFSIGKS